MDKNEEKEQSNFERMDTDKEKIIKNEIFKKKYRVPDANNKKKFDKINHYNFIGITKFLTFIELTEMSFVNQKFYKTLCHHYYKKIPMIKKSITNMKKIIFLKFSEDFCFYLGKNSFHIREIIKKIVESFILEYSPKLGIKKYFFSKNNFNNHITKIFLNNCEIGKKSMKYLSFYFYNPNCKIIYIDLTGNKISGEILRPIESNEKIELDCIIADKCIIDVKTLKILSKIKTKQLSLVNNNIDNELISKLASDYISELNISNNIITSDGVLNICKNMPNLTKLNLSNNNLCDLSTIYLSLYIKNPKSKLVNLNLKENKITIKGMITLITSLNFNNREMNNRHSFKKLNLSCNLLDYISIPEELGTKYLDVNLEKLCLSNHRFNTDNLNILFNFINNIKNIKVLDLSQTVFNNKSINLIFKRVSENITLKKLKLKNCYLGNIEASNNSENNHSESTINIDNNNNTINNIKDGENIEKNNEIKESDKYMEYIGVESLDLGYNFINYKQLDKLIISNHVKELNLEGNDLHIWGNDLYLFFDIILDNNFLEKLNLKKNNLQNMGNKLLEKLYEYNNEKTSVLKYLSLEENQIQNINLELTNLLSNNKNLETLNLQNNLVNDDIGNNYFFHSLFKNKNSNIKEINLSNNKITLEFIDKVIKYSKENELDKNNFILNINSKEIRNAYLNKENKSVYWDIIKLNCIKCF